MNVNKSFTADYEIFKTTLKVFRTKHKSMSLVHCFTVHHTLQSALFILYIYILHLCSFFVTTSIQCFINLILSDALLRYLPWMTHGRKNVSC